MRDPRELSASFMDPQMVPADHCYVVLQDHGVDDGGWGPAALDLPWFPVDQRPRPFVYTGDAPHVLEAIIEFCGQLAEATGRPTRLVRFSRREDVAVFPGAE